MSVHSGTHLTAKSIKRTVYKKTFIGMEFDASNADGRTRDRHSRFVIDSFYPYVVLARNKYDGFYESFTYLDMWRILNKAYDKESEVTG